MTLSLYVYGNGAFIYTILTSVGFFMLKAKSFFMLAAILSLLVFAFEATGVMPTRGYDWTKFIKIYVLISLFVITPFPGTVNVHDVITNNDREFNFQNNKLPIGLIVPIAMTSDIMHRLIEQYQKYFEIDSNLNYTYSGMNFGANFIKNLDNANSYDDKFNYNLDHYMQNCGFPLLHKKGATAQLRTSTDILATLIQYTSAARYVQQLDFNSAATVPIVKSCQQAITEINSYYDANKDKFMLSNAKMTGIGSGDSFTRYMNAASATTDTLLRISRDASTALKQAIAMNMIMASVKNGAQAVGNGSLALSAYDAEQFQQYKKSSELSGSATARTIPILVGLGFAMLFFLYPVMIFLAIAMGSYKAIGVFFQIIIAINLIPLIYEIINYISNFYLQEKLGTVIVGQGYNYDISTSLYSLMDNTIIVCNYLATSAPLIAYAIVTGSSVALTSVFGHINDPAKSQSMQVGGEMARGNLQMGNSSIDNYSFNNVQGNKLDDQLSMNTGAPIFKDTTSGGIHTNVGGQNYDQNFKSDLLATPNLTQMASTSLQNSLSHNKQQMGQLSEQWGQQQQRLHELSNSLQSGQSSSFASGSEEGKLLQHAQNLSTSIRGQLSATAFGSGANASITSATSDYLQKNINEYEKTANVLSHSSNQALRDAFSNTNTLTSNSSKTISETLATSQALNDVNSTQSSINANFSNSFDNYLRSQGLDPKHMTVEQQTAAAQPFVEQQLNSIYGIKSHLQTVPANTTGIDNLANNASSNNISSNDLEKPSNGKDLAKKSSNSDKKSHDEIANFNQNQGDYLGRQLQEQANTGAHIAKNVAELGAKALYDIAHPDRIRK